VCLEIVDPVADPAWSELADRDPSATVFHQAAWSRLLREHFGYDVNAWIIRSVDGQIAAGLPVALVRGRVTGTRLISLPFSDACGPLRDPDADIEPAVVAAAIATERDRVGLRLEVRAGLDAPGGVVISRYARHLLALEPDVEQVQRRFAKSQVKRGIAKAIREGVTIEAQRSELGLRRFYALHLSTRRRQGVPTQPKRFILGFTRLFEQGLGFVLLARRGGRDIAGAVFLTGGSTLTYKYGASRRSDLAARPNNLLFMEAIRWGCEHGMRTLDFGRTDLDNEGLLAFKRSWGAEEAPLAYISLGGGKPDRGPGLAQRAISGVIRHSPPVVGRLVGEALYREFA
jgi:CelD/BcsL family acetyltransferase involved in cellulose biosynthesis